MKIKDGSIYYNWLERNTVMAFGNWLQGCNLRSLGTFSEEDQNTRDELLCEAYDRVTSRIPIFYPCATMLYMCLFYLYWYTEKVTKLLLKGVDK